MVLKLYMIKPSPHVRSTLMTAKAIGVDFEFIRVDLSKREHFHAEFLKINPQHSVPTLNDNGFIVWDSHAVNVYLVLKYGKDDSLYPKDPQKQAIINQRLYFDSSLFFPSCTDVIKPITRDGAKTVPPEKAAVVIDSYTILEKYLEGHLWVAGDTITLADFSLITTTTSIDLLVPIDKVKFPNITAWLKRAQTLPYYDVNQSGLEKFGEMIQKFLQS